MIRLSFAVAMIAFSGCSTLTPQPSNPSDIGYKTIKTDHGPLTLAVRDIGQGRPILLLHGMGTSSYTWRAIAPALSATHRVIALDLRGFGASEKPQDTHYSVADQANVVRAYIQQENLTGLTVVGHSFGGGIALAVALGDVQEQKPRIRDMILIDTIAYRQPLPVAFRLLQVPVVGQFGMSVIPADVQAAQALRIAYYNPDKITDRAIEEYARPLRQPDARHAFTETVNRIIPADIDEMTDRYKKLKLPVQIIWCESDRIIPIALGRRLKDDVPGAEIATIPQCGHLPQEEKPEETLRVMKNFLARRGDR